MAPVERGADQIDNCPEEGEEQEREREQGDEGQGTMGCTSLDHPDSQHAHLSLSRVTGKLYLIFWMKTWEDRGNVLVSHCKKPPMSEAFAAY